MGVSENNLPVELDPAAALVIRVGGLSRSLSGFLFPSPLSLS